MMSFMCSIESTNWGGNQSKAKVIYVSIIGKHFTISIIMALGNLKATKRVIFIHRRRFSEKYTSYETIRTMHLSIISTLKSKIGNGRIKTP
jgi:hypothetical protein